MGQPRRITHIDDPKVIWSAWKDFANRNNLNGVKAEMIDNRYTACEFCPYKGQSLVMGVIDTVISRFFPSKGKTEEQTVKKSAPKIEGIWCTSAKRACNCAGRECVREDIHCSCPLSKTLFAPSKGCPENFWRMEVVDEIKKIKEANPEATTAELKELIQAYLMTLKT